MSSRFSPRERPGPIDATGSGRDAAAALGITLDAGVYGSRISRFAAFRDDTERR
jgi:hypothetical protein